VNDSLRIRLLVGAVVWIALALVAAGIVIAIMFASNVEQTLRTELAASLTRMVALIDRDAAPPRLSAQLADPRYDTPQSGAYWQVVDVGSGQMARSRSLWDHVLSVPPTEGAEEAYYIAQGPSGQRLSVLTRQVRFQSGDRMRTYRVFVAENRRVLDESIERFGWDLVAALAVLGVTLMGAAWLQVHLGLQPLRALREGIEAIRRGKTQRLPSDYPSEVSPLVGEVNELLDTQERAIEHARSRASDLAHGLKAPLSALHGVAADLRTSGREAEATAIEELSGEMSERIDYQLRLAGLRLRSRAHQLSASVRDVALRNIAVLRRSERGEQIAWDVELADDLAVDMDPRDLAELLGVLLENAAKWAKSRVLVAGSEGDAFIDVVIADDGPGLSNEDIGRLGKRGQRLDETAPGSGLGLAIAAEIVSLNGGEMRFARAPGGGLAVQLHLRSASAAASQAPA
jgi:signal transduction histidine kinase